MESGVMQVGLLFCHEGVERGGGYRVMMSCYPLKN